MYTRFQLPETFNYIYIYTKQYICVPEVRFTKPNPITKRIYIYAYVVTFYVVPRTVWRFRISWQH